MIARPKISRNERKTAEKGAFEVGNFAPFSCPGYGVVADSTPPTLDAFVLDLDGGALSLAFDEPVTRRSLDLTKIVLSADEDEEDNAEAPADALAPYSTTLSIYLGNAYATLPISDQDSTYVKLAASDSADAWSYRLTNATSEMYVAYDGKGEGVVQINLGAADVAALKLADGAAGVAVLGTTVDNTMVGLDASFIRSAHGRPGIPRVLGDAKLGGVKTFQMVPDNANPTVERCDVDMVAPGQLLRGRRRRPGPLQRADGERRPHRQAQLAPALGLRRAPGGRGGLRAGRRDDALRLGSV